MLSLVLPASASESRGTSEYPVTIGAHLRNLYDEKARRLAFRADSPTGVERWQIEARAALRVMLGLDRIAGSAGPVRPPGSLEPPVDCGDYFRQKGLIETEPGVQIPCWVLLPKRPHPWPIGIFPHGHDRCGHDTTAGVYTDADHEKKSIAEDRDVAVQAVKLGFLAIAPATRGISTHIVPDLDARHGERDCRSHAMHCLMAGRTALGERVWDVQRILDWALTRPGVDPGRVLIMGNSGGGMVTMFAAACDERFTVAIPSCSFAPSVSRAGYIFHCDCNTVPGLMDIGGLTGVVGLIAPRSVLAINGRKDSLLPLAEVERAADEVRAIYSRAGAAQRFAHRWGDEGHRFYQNLMWPFVLEAIAPR